MRDGSFAALPSRRRIRLLLYTAAAALALGCLIAGLAAAAGSGGALARARALCDALRPAETDGNSVVPWATWLHAVGKVYLHYDREELQAQDPTRHSKEKPPFPSLSLPLSPALSPSLSPSL